jgi:flagellar biosynthesis anti-sigma factor FlgM
MVDPVTFVPLARLLSATDPSFVPPRAASAPPTVSSLDVPPANDPPTYVTTLRNVAAQGAPVDTERVASLRARIDQGTYPVDNRRIADAMLGFVGSER